MDVDCAILWMQTFFFSLSLKLHSVMCNHLNAGFLNTNVVGKSDADPIDH